MLKNHKRSFILNFLANEGLFSSSFKYNFDKPITKGEKKKLKGDLARFGLISDVSLSASEISPADQIQQITIQIS